MGAIQDGATGMDAETGNPGKMRGGNLKLQYLVFEQTE
jgi:hypothetical protein